MQPQPSRDHGGGLDAAIHRFGGARLDWLDLSTGINPVPYPFTQVSRGAWTDLPDRAAQTALCNAARRFWSVPDGLDVLAVPGASAAIAQIPRLQTPGRVAIPGPTYNEHAAAFQAAGWQVCSDGAAADAQVIVQPNNPTGRYWSVDDLATPFTVVDESFCDIAPERSLLARYRDANTLVLKSFGKFWGLAGLRLGFVIGRRELLDTLAEMIGPWPVSGVALEIGRQALDDIAWAETTRGRLSDEAERLDACMIGAGADVIGGTSLFRLYAVDDAARWQERLAQRHIWSRAFPYSTTWLRLGLPVPERWSQLEAAL